MARVLLIGLDAAEPRLVEPWMEDGTLPHLRRLRDEQGAYARLGSTANWLPGSVWPSFYTSTPPSEHGLYYYLAWRPERMSVARADRDFLPLEPFWRDLAARGKRVVILDVPRTFAPAPFDGIEVEGWATHEAFETPASHPPELLAWIGERFGPPPRADERHHLLPIAELLRVGPEQSRATERIGALASALMEREPWDLFFVGFGATHRAGHKLWDETGASDARPGDAERISEALRDVYVAVDREVGRLVERAGPETTVIVFSLHGMGPNTCRATSLGPMLGLVLRGDAGESVGAPPGDGLVDRLRAAVPERWRQELKRHLPLALQDRLTAYWRLHDLNWNETRAFSLPGDANGYVRINLKGREARGVVTPGDEYETLCASIEAGLRDFRDLDTGEPVVADIARPAELHPPGRCSDLLPDLVVKWTDAPVAQDRAFVSAIHGRVESPMPGRNVNGRSGNHRGQGFLIVAGRSAPGPANLEGCQIMDLAPTVYGLLGLEPQETMRGRSLVAGLPIGRR